MEKNILKRNTVKDKTFHMIFFAIMSHVTDVDSWITGPMLSSLMSFFFSEIAKSNTDEKILYSLSKTFFINHFYGLICLRTKVKPSTTDSSSHFHTHSQDCGQCRVNRWPNVCFWTVGGNQSARRNPTQHTRIRCKDWTQKNVSLKNKTSDTATLLL